MTAGITIGFAMECFEKGLIGLKDTDGIELRFGNDQAMIAALKKLVKLEGFGKQLAKGTKRLSEEIKGSEGFAMHAKGMEFGGYECRGLNGQALQFAISARGGCHHAYGLPARAETHGWNPPERRRERRTGEKCSYRTDALRFADPLHLPGTDVSRGRCRLRHSPPCIRTHGRSRN